MNILGIFRQQPLAVAAAPRGGGGVAGGNILAGLYPKPTSNGLREQASRAMVERDNRDFDRGSKRLRHEVKHVLGITVESYQVIRRDETPIVTIDGLDFRLHDPGSYKYLQVEWTTHKGKEWLGFSDLAGLAEILEGIRERKMRSYQ